MSATTSLKDQAIRDAEQLIDKKRAKFDELMEEAARAEEEIAEARSWLHFLKTGKESPVRAAPTVAFPGRPADEPADEPVRTTVSRDQYRTACLTFGSREFVVRDIMEKAGASKEGTRWMLGELVKEGYLVRVNEPKSFGSAGGNRPATLPTATERVMTDAPCPARG